MALRSYEWWSWATTGSSMRSCDIGHSMNLGQFGKLRVDMAIYSGDGPVGTGRTPGSNGMNKKTKKRNILVSERCEKQRRTVLSCHVLMFISFENGDRVFIF